MASKKVDRPLVVLREIRDELREIRGDLRTTNARVDTLSKRVDDLRRYVPEMEIRLASAITAMVGAVRDGREV